jgi:hypothetical protein
MLGSGFHHGSRRVVVAEAAVHILLHSMSLLPQVQAFHTTWAIQMKTRILTVRHTRRQVWQQRQVVQVVVTIITLMVAPGGSHLQV